MDFSGAWTWGNAEAAPFAKRHCEGDQRLRAHLESKGFSCWGCLGEEKFVEA